MGFVSGQAEGPKAAGRAGVGCGVANQLGAPLEGLEGGRCWGEMEQGRVCSVLVAAAGMFDRCLSKMSCGLKAVQVKLGNQEQNV